MYTLVARARAVVPVKPFALAKQRVRQLSPVRRQELAQLLVRNVVCALRGSGSIGEIVLVGGAEARELAQEFDATWASDPGLGLNAAVAAGLECCAPEAPRLVVMGDLPLLGPDDVRRALEGMLAPERKETVQGTAEVRQTFRVSKVGTIAGCYVSEGRIDRKGRGRIIRGGVVVYDGEIASLKRFKDDAREVREGLEGNLCRCTGYHNIVQAVLAAARQGAGVSAGAAS